MNQLIRGKETISRFVTMITDKFGRVLAVNKRRLYENPFFLMTNPPNNDVDVPISTTSDAVGMRVSGEGPMQLTMIGAAYDALHGGVSSTNMLARMYMRDGTQTSMLMNAPVHLDAISGPGGQMYPLPEALYVDESRALSIMYTNLVASATHARTVLAGAKYQQLRDDQSLERVKERLQNTQFVSTPFIYTTDGGPKTVAANSNLSAEISIDAGHNFEIHQLSFVSTGTFDINIIDIAKGESLINAPQSANFAVPSAILLGTGSNPFRFHEPILVFGGQKLQVSLYDTSGSSNVVYLALGGRAIKVRQWT